MDQVLKNQVTRANPHILSHRFFFPLEKKKFFFISSGFFVGTFSSPCPWQALLPQVWTTPERLPWSEDTSPLSAPPTALGSGLSRPATLGGSPGGPEGSWEQEVGKGLRRRG